MGKCSKCNGSGKCKNGIHKGRGFIGIFINQTTGGMYTCKDCGGSANNPKKCKYCNGTGKYK